MATPSAKARSLMPGPGAVPGGAAVRAMDFALPVPDNGVLRVLDRNGDPVEGATATPWNPSESMWQVTGPDGSTSIFRDDGELVMREVEGLVDGAYAKYYVDKDGARIAPEMVAMTKEGDLDGVSVDQQFPEPGGVPEERAVLNEQQQPRFERLRQTIVQTGGDLLNNTGASDNLRTIQETLAEVRRTDVAIREALKNDPVVRSRLSAMVEFAGGDPLSDNLLAPVDAPFNPQPSKRDAERAGKRMEAEASALDDLPDEDQEARRQWQKDNRDALVGPNAPESASTQAAAPPAGKVRLEKRAEIDKPPSTRTRMPKPPLDGRLSAYTGWSNREMLIRDLNTGEWRTFDPVGDATRASEARVAPALFDDSERRMYHRDLERQQKTLDRIGDRMQRLASVRDMFDQQMANAAGYLPNELRTRAIVDASPAERAGITGDMPQGDSAAQGAFNPNTEQWDYLSYGTNDIPLSDADAARLSDELAQLLSQRDAADAAAIRMINRMRQIQGNPEPYVDSLLQSNPSLERGAAIDPQISAGVSQLGRALGDATSVRELADSAIELQGAINESQMLGRRIAQLRRQLGNIDDGIPGSPLPGAPDEKPLLGEQLQQASAFRVADRRGLPSRKPLYQRQGQLRSALTQGRFGREVSPDRVVGPEGLYPTMQDVMDRATLNNPMAQTPEGLNTQMMGDEAAKMFPRAYGIPVSPSWNPLDDPLPAFDAGRRYPGRQNLADSADVPEGLPPKGDTPDAPAPFPEPADIPSGGTPQLPTAEEIARLSPEDQSRVSELSKQYDDLNEEAYQMEMGGNIADADYLREQADEIAAEVQQIVGHPNASPAAAFADPGDVPAKTPTAAPTTPAPQPKATVDATPAAIALAEELGIDINTVTPSNGKRVTKRDVQNAAKAPPQVSGFPAPGATPAAAASPQAASPSQGSVPPPKPVPQPAAHMSVRDLLAAARARQRATGQQPQQAASQPAAATPQAGNPPPGAVPAQPAPSTSAAARARQRATAQTAPQPATTASPAARARQRAQSNNPTPQSPTPPAKTLTPAQKQANKTWFERNYGKVAAGGVGLLGAYMYSQSGGDSAEDMMGNFLRNSNPQQATPAARRSPEDAAVLQQTLDRIRRSSSGGQRVRYQTGQNPIGIEMF